MRLIRPLAALAASALLVGTVSTAASAQTRVTEDMFGMHVINIASGGWPDVPVGSVRLWDTGTTWGQIETKQGKFDWTAMDTAVATAEAQGAPVLYVLGGTPAWAGDKKKISGELPYPGAASAPKKMSYWTKWVDAVTKRYGDRIEAYQIWNEPSLTTFWRGSVPMMGKMTVSAAKIIRKNAPKSKIVSASTSTRWEPAFRGFFPGYLQQLRAAKWPVDVIAAHLYPASTGTPSSRIKYIEAVKADMQRAGVPKRIKLWDTEINYGLAGPGARFPDKDIDGRKAAAFVAQTYLDNVRYGVQRAYWYAWTPPNDLLGVHMWPGTDGAESFATVESWLANGKASCGQKGKVNTCTVTKNGQKSTIAWTRKGSATFTAPKNTTHSCNALGLCSEIKTRAKNKVTTLPTWFGVLVQQ